MFKILIVLVILLPSLLWANEDCSWNGKTPCLVIAKPNSNIINDKVSPTIIIAKNDIDQHNLIDLKSVFKFLNSGIVVQSGPTGQQASVFMRGTNSNHTLVLLNGIPINDQSTTNGAYDFGQDFLFNVQQIEVYKGSAGAHFGADSIGGAINLITDVDYQNKFSVVGQLDSQTLQGNYATNINDWTINVQGGMHKSKTESALAGGTDLDGTQNKSIGVNIYKWITDKLKFRSNVFVRNTYTDLDGHSLALQNGYDSDNSLYAFQTGFDYNTKNSKNYITLHTHSYDREYDSPNLEFDNYESDSYVLRAEHSSLITDGFVYGLGFEYKHDQALFENQGSYNSSLDGNYDNVGIFANVGYNFDNDWSTSLNVRTDKNNVVGDNNAYKFGIIKEKLLPKIDLRFNHAVGYKNPSLYQLYGADNFGYKGNNNLKAEESTLNELNFDYSINSNHKITMSMFENEIGNVIEYKSNTYKNNNIDHLNQSGIELSYGYQDTKNKITVWGNSLSSEKTDGSAQLRRPEHSMGINYQRTVTNTWSYYANYSFMGEHFDTHNSNYSTIVMPETHLLDIGITKNYYGFDLGLSINNVFDQDYERPHGFSQNKRKINFILKRKF